MRLIIPITMVLIIGLIGIFSVIPMGAETYDCWALGDYDQSWGVARIGAPQVHSQGNTGQAVKLCIVDTGIDYTHPELAPIYKGGYDFVNHDADPMDDHYHGTHCAGIAAAAIGDGTTVGGVAPGVELYAAKVLSGSGQGIWSDVVDAINWCIANDIDVMSFSLGGAGGTPELEAAFQNAWDAGIVTIAAAGNSGGDTTTDKVLYPARYDTVMAVAAMDITDLKATFSSTGPAVEVAAPGVNVYSCSLGGTYRLASGTSMACPHVSGLACLVKSAHPTWTNDQIRGQIRGTADDLYTPGQDWLTGFGYVDAVEACGELVNYPPMPPCPPPPGPPVVATNPATNMGDNIATLNGTLTNMGYGSTSVQLKFYWGKRYESAVSSTPTVTYTTPGSFSYVLTGLEPATEYRFCAVAIGSNGKSSNGLYLYFATTGGTPPPPPTYHEVRTLPATEITSNSAKLNGEIISTGTATQFDCNFAIYLGDGSTGWLVGKGIMTSAGVYSFTITSYGGQPIPPNTTYRYSFMATSKYTYRYGAYQYFTTLPSQPPTQYTLTTSVEGQGTVTPSGGTYNAGTVLSMKATPAAGWQFDYWSGDLSGSQNPANLTIDANKTVIAHFSEVPPLRELKVNAFTFIGGIKSGSITIKVVDAATGTGEQNVQIRLTVWKNGKVEYTWITTNADGEAQIKVPLSPGTWSAKINSVAKSGCTCTPPSIVLTAVVSPK